MNDDNLIETISYKGYDIEIFYDSYTDSPDEWGNDDAFIVYDHRQFAVNRKGFEPEDIFEIMQKGKALFDGYYYFPLYAHIHSGVSLLSLSRGSDRWDTSFKGFVLVKREKSTWDKDKAHTRAESEVKIWNMYLSGDVYGYKSEAGSCWGFYGEEGREEMIKEAKDEIDYLVRERLSNILKS